MVSFVAKKRIEADYSRRLRIVFSVIEKNIVGMTIAEAEKKIIEITASPQFDKLVNLAVSKMITMVKADNEKTWRAAAVKGSFGKQFNKSLKDEMSKKGTQAAVHQILMDNAKLIKSVPQAAARRITQQVYEEYLKGNRGVAIQRIVSTEAPLLTTKRIRLIARTEVAKANTAMTEVRSRDMGADWYIWRSSKDERVRSSHHFMEGVLVSWDSSPNPESLSGEKNRFGAYHAGCCPNCRCYAEPFIDAIQLPARVKVYTRGRIQAMTQRQFLIMIGIISA